MVQLVVYLQQLGLNLDDFLRETLRDVLEMLMELEVSMAIDAGYYERSEDRVAYRNGYRERVWDTQFGEIPLRIPRLRRGSYYPSFLMNGAEQEIVALIHKAYVYGVRVDDIEQLLQALDLPSPHQSVLAQIAEALDETVHSSRNHPLDGHYPYLWLDVIEITEEQAHRALNRVAALAVGVRESGEHDVLGFEVGSSRDDERFWLRFLRRLVSRGLSDVRLVVSADYGGLKAAVYEILAGAEWQYCRSRCLQEVVQDVPEAEQPEVIIAISSIFVQPDQRAAREQLRRVVDDLRHRWPRAMAALESAGDDLLAYMTVPQDEWMIAASTNALLRVKHALESNTDAIGISPEVMLIGETEIDYWLPIKPSVDYELEPAVKPSGMEVVHVLAER